MATLLVIGGSGFFGKSVLDLFQRGGLAPWGITHVIAMARRASALRVSAPGLLSSQVTLLDDDIASTTSLPAADYVIHAAASTDARNYQQQPEQEKRNIQAGTLNYCRLAPLYHRGSRIVYASSGAVYGQQPPELERLDEDDDPGAPAAPSKRDYALAKRDAEAAIVALGAAGLQVSIARCFAFVGPWLPRDQHFAIGNFIGDALAGRPITVQARHAVYRSYLYADDLVEWLMALASQASPACPVCNVGSEQPVLMGELAQLVARAAGQQAAVPAIDNPMVDRYIPSTARIRALAGVRMRYDLEHAVATTLARLRASPD
ncbi:NAD-dependent epimerase/dehydratase family protein [Oxalobacteraceae bacterium A2-2]